MFVGEKLRKIS